MAIREVPLNEAREISSMDRENLKVYEIDPPEEFKTGKKRYINAKACYVKAFQYLANCKVPDQARLIHGVYKPHGVNNHTGHAWVEIDGNIIFDGVLQRFYNKEGYFSYYKAIELSRYTRNEMFRTGLENGGHYGPWND